MTWKTNDYNAHIIVMLQQHQMVDHGPGRQTALKSLHKQSEPATFRTQHNTALPLSLTPRLTISSATSDNNDDLFLK